MACPTSPSGPAAVAEEELHGSGPQAMCIGCAGFAAFSAAIDAMGFGPHGDH